MNDHQQIMHLRKSRGLIIICLLSIVLGLTTAFIAIQAEAASTEIVASTEYMDSSSIGQPNKNIAVANSVLTSDDFNNCSLNTALWTFVDPLGDGTLAVEGGKAWLSVPSGTLHSVWVDSGGDFFNTVPRLV